jgi:hypothetical protein
MKLSPCHLFMKRMFVNKVLRSVLGCKKEEISASQRKYCNEEFYNVCASPNVVGVINLRNLWCTAYVNLNH